MPGSEQWQRQDMTAVLAQVLSWTKGPGVLVQDLSQTPTGRMLGLLGMLRFLPQPAKHSAASIAHGSGEQSAILPM